MQRRKVTKLTRERAFATIKIVAKAALTGETAITYSDLAQRLQMPNETGQGLGPILNEATSMCVENNPRLPDVSAFIVTKDSFEKGKPMPSENSFVDGRWPISGLSVEDIPSEQDRIREFDWRSVKSLGLSFLL